MKSTIENCLLMYQLMVWGVGGCRIVSFSDIYLKWHQFATLATFCEEVAVVELFAWLVYTRDGVGVGLNTSHAPVRGQEVNLLLQHWIECFPD
jgi:hypothetical protein